MSENFNPADFCVIPNADHWIEYKDQLANYMSRETHEMNFPEDPDRFPCLVATSLRVASIKGTEEGKQYEVHACFVYEADAELLLSRSVKKGGPPKFEIEESEIDKMMAESPWLAGADEVPTIEPDLSILVLAMLKELVAVGAIKTDRLFSELQPMTDKLKAFHKSGVNPESSVTEFIQDLWGAVGDDAN